MGNQYGGYIESSEGYVKFEFRTHPSSACNIFAVIIIRS